MFKTLCNLFSPSRDKKHNPPSSAPSPKGAYETLMLISRNQEAITTKLDAIRSAANKMAVDRHSPVAAQGYSIQPGGHPKTVRLTTEPSNPKAPERLLALRHEADRHGQAPMAQGCNLTRTLPDNKTGSQPQTPDGVANQPRFLKVENGFMPISAPAANEINALDCTSTTSTLPTTRVESDLLIIAITAMERTTTTDTSVTPPNDISTQTESSISTSDNNTETSYVMSEADTESNVQKHQTNDILNGGTIESETKTSETTAATSVSAGALGSVRSDIHHTHESCASGTASSSGSSPSPPIHDNSSEKSFGETSTGDSLDSLTGESSIDDEDQDEQVPVAKAQKPNVLPPFVPPTWSDDGDEVDMWEEAFNNYQDTPDPLPAPATDLPSPSVNDSNVDYSPSEGDQAEQLSVEEPERQTTLPPFVRPVWSEDANEVDMWDEAWEEGGDNEPDSSPASQATVPPRLAENDSQIDAWGQAFDQVLTAEEFNPAPPVQKFHYATREAQSRLNYIKRYLSLPEDMPPVRIILKIMKIPTAPYQAACDNPALLRAALDIDWDGIINDLPWPTEEYDPEVEKDWSMMQYWIDSGARFFAWVDKDHNWTSVQPDERSVRLSWETLFDEEYGEGPKNTALRYRRQFALE